MNLTKLAPILVTITTSLFISTTATAQVQFKPFPRHTPTAQVVDNGTKLKINYGRKTQTIKASSLNVGVLDTLNCKQVKILPQQKLSGKQFVKGAISFHPKTGNLAVGVLLQECLETQVSAVFVLQPQKSWGSYAIYRVQIPGKRQLPDEFYTYPFSSITRLGYFGEKLLVEHGDASGAEAMLVFNPSRTPSGKYTGCVVTRQGEGLRLCPQ
ncbi:MAG: hypothetical protein QNJ51_14445 [Calothrix sp. MO_167.B12]|nr:hypothetical protein [Calothrix sp. MO_167.B12]